jgi:hypothetical protein
MPLSDAIANSILDGYARNVSFANAAVWCKLHTGDPGTAGTSNVAGETTRAQASFSAGAASRTIANSADSTWTNVSTNETYSWLSFWTANAAGTFTGRVQLTASKAVTTGDTFTIPAASLTLTVT